MKSLCRHLRERLTRYSLSQRNALRRKFKATLVFERLESRELLAADFLYDIDPRLPVNPLISTDYFGFSQASNDLYHVIGNAPALDGETIAPYFTGEVQVHSAVTGALLRTIENPEPNLGFSFGSPVAVYDDYILVGTFGVDTYESSSVFPLPDLSGRAYLFDATNGNLIHTFQDNFSTFRDETENLDAFGSSLAIEGNYIVIGAPGIDPAPELDVNSDDPGHTYVFNRTTGALIRRIENPGPVYYGFGRQVGISQGRLFASGGNQLPTFPFHTYSVAHIYDPSATSGPPLRTIQPTNPVPGGGRILMDGDLLTLSVPGAVELFDVDDGSFIASTPNFNPVDLDGNLVIQPVFGSTTILGTVRSLPSGNVVHTIFVPPGYNPPAGNSGYSGVMTIEGDRALVLYPQYGVATQPAVLVYALSNGPVNQPPTDIAITNNVIAENSANGTVIGTFSATDPTPAESFTFSLTNNAGGRFSINGTQLRVANGSLLDFETNTSHNVTVQVTDSANNTYSEVFTIQITNANDAPTNISLSNNFVAESSVRRIHNLDPQANQAFGYSLAVSNNRILVSDQFQTVQGGNGRRVHVRNATTGESLMTLVHPNPLVDPVSFGSDLALSGNLAVVANVFEDVGVADSAGVVYVFDVVTGNLLHTLVSPTPALAKNFGQSVTISGNLIAVGSADGALNAGMVYLFDATTGALLEAISNPQPALHDGFGNELVIHGNRIIVGSTHSDVGATNAGRIYIFDYNPTTTAATLEVTINNPMPVTDDRFGSSIEISNNLLAASSGRSTGGISFPGVVHLFDLATGNYLRSLANPSPGAFDFLGTGLAFSGDYVIASSSTDIGGVNSGRAYVFRASTGVLIGSINNPSPAANEHFGWSIVAIGNQVFVSAPFDNADGPSQGMIYVYDLAFGQTVGTLSTTDLDVGDTFTYSLTNDAGGRFAIVEDQIVIADATKLNFEANPSHNITVQVTDSAGNTYSEVMTILVTNVAEPPTDLQLTDRAVRESAPNGTWVSWIDNMNPNASDTNDSFSQSIAADNGKIVYGDFGNGSIFITDELTGDLLHVIDNPTGNVGDFFGAEVAIKGNLVVVSARFHNGLANNTGRVYVYNATTGQLVYTLHHPNPVANDEFGSSVSISDDRIAVGARVDGSAFVFNANNGNLLFQIDQQGFGFGSSVKLTDTRLVVGNPSFSSQIGQITIYDDTLGILQTTIDNPNPANSGPQADFFGDDIEVVGTQLLTVAPGEDAGASDTGIAYVFSLTSGALLETLNLPVPIALDYFGSTLAITTGKAAIGNSSNDRNIRLYSTSNWQPSGVITTNSTAFFRYGLTFVNDGLMIGTSPNPGADRVQVFNTTTLQQRSGFRVSNPVANDTYTFALLDDAGGRFSLVGDQLVVANSDLLDAELNPTHTVTVRVTNSAGLSLDKLLTINVINNNDAPTDIALNGSTVQESSVRFVHNPPPEPNRSFGRKLAVSGNRMLVNDIEEDFDVATPAKVGRVAVVDTATGERLATLVSPNPIPNGFSVDGYFGSAAAISGNLAVISAYVAEVGGVSGVGVVYAFDMTSGAVVHTFTSPDTNKVYFGASVAASGNIIAIGSSDGPQGAGQVYLYNATTGVLLDTIANPNPGQYDLFGHTLALQGTTLVVASQIEQVGQNTAVGRAYLYYIDPATSQAALVSTLNNPTPAAQEFFGTAVAATEDLVAISVVGHSGSTDEGEVYVFSAATGNLLRTIPHPNPVANDSMGSSLAFSGPYLIARSSASNVGSTGRAFVFHPTSGALVATIHNPSPDFIDAFGWDIVTDGNRVVISALNDDTDGPNQGMVYVYELPFGQAVGTLATTDPDAGETFTYSLINDADGRFAINGNQIVIADATKLDFEAATSHNVTVQVTDAGGNTYSKDFTITVTPENEPPQDIVLTGNTVPESQMRFIHDPAIQKDLSFGYETETDGDLIVVGTNQLPSNPAEAYVMDATSGALVSTLVSPSSVHENFAERVAISGNLAVVSARTADIGATNSGAAYLFNATTGGLLHTLLPPTPSADLQFGAEIAISGNLIAVKSQSNVYLFNATTGSHLQTIVVGNLISDMSLSGDTIVIGIPSAGVVRVHQFNPATQLSSFVRDIAVPEPTAADLALIKVRVEGNVIAVGARLSDIGALNSGRVHLFDRTTGSLLTSIVNPTPAPNDNFGHFLAIEGEHIAIAAQFDDTDAIDSGRVYVFKMATGELVSTIVNPSPNSGDFFSRVSFVGNRLVIGTPTDDTDAFNSGGVYVYVLPFNQAVGSLSGTDPDSGDALSYTLVDDANGRFKLVGNSIVVADPSRFDFETATSHQITLQVTDATGLSTYETIEIQVASANEAPQDISFTGTSVNENAPNGTVVSTLSTTDPDVGDSVTYSLLDNAGGRFAIVGNQIVVANVALLDFETATSHTVTVRASDAGGKFVLETLKINVLDGPEALDFGDLPNSFGTSLAANGARHVLSNTLRLGATVSSEANGQPSANANLDSGDDGVTLPFLLVPGLNATTTIVASQSGRLDAFIDFNGNGAFAESERITPAAGLLLNAGANTFLFAVPGTANSGNQGARFRISTAGGLSPTGLAADGEVEDYRISILVPNPLSSQVLADPEFPGLTMMYVKGSGNDDDISVNQNAGGLRATINGVQGAVLFPTSRVVVFGLGGDDDLRINGTTMPGTIDGGPDDDTIRGGNGPDLLFGRGGDDSIYGRNGDDTIYGGSGDDTLESNGGIGYLFGEGNSDTLTGNGILVGGNGSDELNGTGSRNVLIGGNGGDLLTGANANQGDIIIAGITSYDSDLVALKAIRDEWKESTPVNSRIAHLDGPTPGGLNVPYYLNVNSVFSENASDTIVNFGTTNPTRNDWIFRSPNDIKTNPPGIVVTILNSPPAMMFVQTSGNWNQDAILNNSDQPSDVDGDGITTPLDVLLVINQLNTSNQLPEFNGSTNFVYLDTNDDGTISPLDALLVINRLNLSNSKSHSFPDDLLEEQPMDGSVDDVFKLLGEGEADLKNLWAGADRELETSILALTLDTTKRRRR